MTCWHDAFRGRLTPTWVEGVTRGALAKLGLQLGLDPRKMNQLGPKKHK